MGNIFGRFVLAGLGDRIDPLCGCSLILTFAVAGASFVLWSQLANGMVNAGAVRRPDVRYELWRLRWSLSGCRYRRICSEPAISERCAGYLYTASRRGSPAGSNGDRILVDRTGSYLGPSSVPTVSRCRPSRLHHACSFLAARTIGHSSSSTCGTPIAAYFASIVGNRRSR